MFLYKIVNIHTNRVFVGLSKKSPHNTLQDKYDLIEREEGLPPFERDLLNFGLHAFNVIPVCELRNEAKAKKKANRYIQAESFPYNIFYYEVFQ